MVRTVIANEDITEPELLQGPKEYWEHVLYALDVLRVQSMEVGNTILPPLSVATSESIVFFAACVDGTDKGVNAAVKKLEIRLR